MYEIVPMRISISIVLSKVGLAITLKQYDFLTANMSKYNTRVPNKQIYKNTLQA